MSIGRPQEFNYDEVLDRATETFWILGYDGTSMVDLLSKTGLSKSSLYQTFGGKAELFQKCLENYTRFMSKSLLNELKKYESGKDFIEYVLISSTKEANSKTKPRGCFIMNTATEFSKRDSAILGYVENGISEFRRIFILALAKSQMNGEIDKHLDLEEVSFYIISVMTGLRTLIKGGMKEAEALTTIKLAMTCIK
ncbi:MAG: hypothetical protein COW00_14875 [Bdellovibrio sp. CG12_big_fil_rev_8_21_14_0_65_39_13]|nr:MAG: hypothetical protein COW78_13875 [Bdellovibrio sp. CG22_combo_CG10-13_8_21_14_all_39_27]PIQ58577.1 MAG: hypothetical protein COW00_14875 [Bdellovibrio sp. CG12_big_fil_rev_8_21_14_0_65_39_13]PIR32440.1 MAG: hypothetical protein COV37_19730 [Bdellovibrio sp. CG11_big_fil_rev_8_21_14_0_20_39_38]